MSSKHLDPRPFVRGAADDKYRGIALYHDVGYGLRRASSQRTRSFRMPVVYSNTLADFNNWDMMFMERLVGGITMHKPVVAPAAVLTLGNGFDFWAIHAAQKWPNCRVTAHSLLGNYKDGMDTLIRSLRLVDRVKYVRGDPSRELRLTYPNNSFDMVRLSYCSLNLAETEWYVFLQEVYRVLKPGGVLEVIEEDLLFPGNKPPPSESNPNVPPGQHHCPQPGLVPPLSACSDSHLMRSPDSRTIDLQNTPPSYPSSPVDPHSQQGQNSSDTNPPSLQYTIDPFDHSKLTRAWHDMLTSRWISSSITSVLPFYLSAIFQNFRALPALEILMGPSSTLCPLPSEGYQQMIDPEPFRHLTHATVKDDAESSMTWIPKRDAPPHLMPSHAPMHLARMVAIVASCKEAIWGAYNKLYGNDRRLPRLNDERGKSNVHTIREEFEHHWLNWECDMRSRIDMASNTQERLHWNVRLPPRPDPDSDNGRWLKSVKHAQGEKDSIDCATSRPVKPEVVRCVRGFVAWKFTESVPKMGLSADGSRTPDGVGGAGYQPTFSFS